MRTRAPRRKSPVVPSESIAKQASHDTAPPPALIDFMMRGWKERRLRVTPVKGAANFLARREALSAAFRNETLIVPTGHEKIRANDTTFRFRPGSDFYYLTGNTEPDCVLVLEPKRGGHKHILFVEPNPGRSNPTFYTDRAKGELWVGPRLGVPESKVRFQVDEARGLPNLPAYLASLKGKPVRVLRGYSPAVDAAIPADEKRDAELATFLSEMRLIKDRLEIRELEAAIESTLRGFEDVIERLRIAASEREVEGVFNLRARMEGNDVGYGTIAASGCNACVLHWTRNDAAIRRDNLLLLNAGVERDSLYTADITRTLPICGKFSAEQREVYQLVLDAQKAAIAAVKPGNDFLEPHRAAMRVLAVGLERLGILEDAEEALKDENQFYKRYTLHNTSHMLGLDVHDCAKARAENYKYGQLKPGMVLTVEPGLYFQRDDLTVPAKYRGIGVRIEDDVLVTSRGCRVLSEAIPKEVRDVEAWMARVWRERRTRR